MSIIYGMKPQMAIRFSLPNRLDLKTVGGLCSPYAFDRIPNHEDPIVSYLKHTSDLINSTT
jgi:hypothetical protein